MRKNLRAAARLAQAASVFRIFRIGSSERTCNPEITFLQMIFLPCLLLSLVASRSRRHPAPPLPPPHLPHVPSPLHRCCHRSPAKLMQPQPLPLLQLLLHPQKKQRQPRVLPGEAAEEEFTGEANQERKMNLQTPQSPPSLEVHHCVAGGLNNDDEQSSSDEHRFALLYLRINHFREFWWSVQRPILQLFMNRYMPVPLFREGGEA